MRESKLIQLLKSIPAEEVHWLQKFLQSPFYNTHKMPLRLFRFVQRYAPTFDAKKLTKETAFKKLYPGEKYDPQKIRKAMYELAVLVEEFLVAMHLRKHTLQKKQLLLRELGDRNVYDAFEKGTHHLIKQLETLPYQEVDTFQSIHQLQLNYYRHTETAKQKKSMPILQTTVEQLDFYYLLQRQQLEFTIKWHEKLFGTKLKIDSLSKSKKQLKGSPLFKLYDLINRALSVENNQEIYTEIETLFKKVMDRLGKNDQREIIRILINNYSNQINKGQAKHQAKTLALYQLALDHDLIVVNQQIGETTFANIATLGTLEKVFDWVEKFIATYQQYLPVSLRTDATQLSTGLLFFHQQKYDATVELLLNHDFSNSFYIISAKSILMRTYFEQFLQDDSYYDLLIAQTYAYEKFIRRNDLVAESRKQIYLNFILFLRKMSNDIFQHQLTMRLYHKIARSDAVVLKSWLLEKIKEQLGKR